MVRLIAIAVATFSFIGSTAVAQSYSANTSSQFPMNDRYEVVQSEIAAKWTFRLDRFCGNVMQLASTPDGTDTWENMIVESLPKCQGDFKPHYQLFTSGIAAKHTFLINTASGVTWQLVTDKADNSSWALFSQ